MILLRDGLPASRPDRMLADDAAHAAFAPNAPASASDASVMLEARKHIRPIEATYCIASMVLRNKKAAENDKQRQSVVTPQPALPQKSVL